jgi:hypothetical protein
MFFGQLALVLAEAAFYVNFVEHPARLTTAICSGDGSPAMMRVI